MSIQSSGIIRCCHKVNGEAPETSTGQMSFNYDISEVSFSDSPDDFEFFSTTHNEPHADAQWGNGSVEFDVDGDGVDESSNIDFVLERF